MNQPPPGSPPSTLESSEETFCYGHPKRPTKLRCSRCNRPICGSCAIPAAVGQHCPECVAHARKTAPKVRRAIPRTAPAVMGILLINVIIFVLQQLDPSFTVRFAASQPAIALGNEWYRLFTPMFLHHGIMHIAFNSYALYLFGPQVEEVFGTKKFIAMYLASGFIGGVASFLFGPCPTLGAGASGAIFGILGVMLAFVYARRSNPMMSQMLRSILVLIGLNVLIGISVPQIDMFAHGGGLLAGILLGRGFDDRPRAKAAGVQIAVFTTVVGIGIALVAWHITNFTCGGLGI